MTFIPTSDLNGHALILNNNQVDMQIVTSGSAHSIGNIDVKEFKTLTGQRVSSSGQGVFVYYATSLDDKSTADRILTTWGSNDLQTADISNIDYIHLWGDGATSTGTSNISLIF